MGKTTINTQFLLRYDTYTNWKTENPILGKGEVAIAEIATNADSVQNAPSVLFKVGDGTKHYNDLNFVSGLAADVYSWAKSSSKPSYTASEIENLTQFVANLDTDSQYKLDKINYASTDGVSKDSYAFYKKGKNDPDTPESWKMETTFDVLNVEGVNKLISNYLKTLDLANAYDAKGSAAAVEKKLTSYEEETDKALAEIKATADGAAETLNTFIKDADLTENAIDTLKEIQEYITSDGTAAEQVTAKIAALEADSHTHTNKEALDKITDAKITAWDSAEQNAKDYADSLAGNYISDVTTTENKGLKVTKTETAVSVDIDTNVVFVLNGGNASGYDNL